MRRVFPTIAAALALALPAGALAHPHAATDRKIAKLERQVRQLRGVVRVLATDFRCRENVVGISQFGNEPVGAGYLFDPDGVGPQPGVYTTALDGDSSPDADIFVEIYNPSCLIRNRRAPSGHERGLPLWQKTFG
jgi:hypothetical protein